ncbi:MAG: cytochrome c3 family protein [Candidatus Firestonebacteria bacterium]|nr:cytochrome c3 family protein [Candidatus Firestonebacteria bacterium]
MKSKKQLFIISGLFFFCLPSMIYAYFMVIDTIQNKIPVVYFDHNKHFNKNTGLGFACEECHHELKNPEQKPVMCSTDLCHLPKTEPQKDTQVKIPVLKDAYHTMCRGCHKKNEKSYKNAPKTQDCGACHIKAMDKFIEERLEKRQKQKEK